MTIPGVFAFGDLTVDQGNNNALKTLIKCNFPPYGKDVQGMIPTGRFSNGKTPTDLFAEALGIQDLIPAYLDPNLKPEDLPYGVRFASGGSGFDPQTPLLVSVTQLPSQLEQFKKYIGKLKGAVGDGSANKIVSNSLHFVVAGINDRANTYFTIGIRKAQYDISSYADLLVYSASSFIQIHPQKMECSSHDTDEQTSYSPGNSQIWELYQLGARRIAVLGVPPIGCLPSQRTLEGGLLRVCSEEQNMAAQVVNSKLSTALDSLTKKLPQSRVVYFDVYNPFLDIIQHPQDYGFEVNDRGCCGTGNIEVGILCNKYSGSCPDDSKYIFWDSFHPTEKAYKFIVDQVLQKYINRFQ